MQYDANKQQWELTLAHLQSEIREKERELSKSQELIRTLTAATRAATNELDTQLHFSRQIHTVARRTPTTSTPSGAYPQLPTYAHVSPYPQSSPPVSSPVVLGYPPIASSAAPPPASSSSTIHLRHHPGGRLSMDVSGGGIDAREYTAAANQPTAQHTQLHQSTYATAHTASTSSSSGQLRFDELPAEASASAPSTAYVHRQSDAAPHSNARSEASGRVERDRRE
jgi:hypothetical protein